MYHQGEQRRGSMGRKIYGNITPLHLINSTLGFCAGELTVQSVSFCPQCAKGQAALRCRPLFSDKAVGNISCSLFLIKVNVTDITQYILLK